MRLPTPRSSTNLVASAALALSAVATAQTEWTTYQGNAAHDGYVPVRIEPAKLRLAWTKKIGSVPTPRTVHQPVVGDGSVAVFSEENSFWVFDARDGKERWSWSARTAVTVHPPAFVAGQAFVLIRGNGSYVRCFDRDGSQLWDGALLPVRSGIYYAPTVVDGEVYLTTGDRVYSLDAASGKVRWWSFVSENERWTPAVDASRVISYTRGYFAALDRKTGRTLFSVRDTDFRGTNWAQLAPALGGNDDAFVINDGRLIRFDLANKKISYSIKRQFKGQPVLAHGLVFALDGNQLVARRQSDGKPIGNFTKAGQTLTGDLAVTDSHVLCGSAKGTYLVDLLTGKEVWSTTETGTRSIGEGAIFIARPGQLTCVRFADLPQTVSVSPRSQHFARPLSTVTIRGTGFTAKPPPIVTFGGRKASDVVIVNDTTLRCRPPRRGPGEVAVRVASLHGGYELAGGFRYIPALVATGDYRLGGTVALRFECEAGAPLFAAIGLEGTARRVRPFLGEFGLRLDQPLLVVRRTLGTSYVLKLGIPNELRLLGGRSAFQALIGPGSTRNGGEPAAFSNVQIVEVK